MRPFQLDIVDSDIQAMRDRLAHTRWPEQLPGTDDDWSKGVPVDQARAWAQDLAAVDWLPVAGFRLGNVVGLNSDRRENPWTLLGDFDGLGTIGGGCSDPDELKDARESRPFKYVSKVSAEVGVLKMGVRINQSEEAYGAHPSPVPGDPSAARDVRGRLSPSKYPTSSRR